MKQAIILLAVLAGFMQVGYRVAGYEMVYQISYGAIVLMALMISATFLWLWEVRATPLALGMAFSWSGTSAVMGWWWVHHVFDRPGWATQNPVLFGFLSLYFVGAILHFAVIHRSFGWHGMAFVWPVAGAVILSSAIYAFF